jgi:hypothetical protein
MSDLNRIQNFQDGDLVTAKKLTDLIDTASINPSFVSDKAQINASGVDKALDTTIIYDASVSGLKQIKVEELLKVPVTLESVTATNGNITTLTTSEIDGQPNNGITITANDSAQVTGKTWVSSNGNLVTVTSTEHGLASGDVLVITASNSSYNADTAITVTSVDAFTYTLPSSVTNVSWVSANGLLVTVTSPSHGLTNGTGITVTSSNADYNATNTAITVVSSSQFTYTLSSVTPARVASSGTLSYTPARIASAGTLSYTRKGYVSLSGRIRASGESTVSGNLSVVGNHSVTGNATISGNASVSGSLTVAGLPSQRRVDVAILTRELPSGGQHFHGSVSTWVDCNFNTIFQTSPFVINSSSFTGVAGSDGTGIITLPAGTYEFEGQVSNASGGGTGSIVARVRNDTTGVQIKKGNVGKCGGFANGESIVRCIATFATETNIKIQHMFSVQSVNAVPNNDGTSEQVFVVRITRYA